MQLAKTIDDLHPRLAALRRDLHAHPELGFQERRTADIVASHLEALGIEVHRGIAETGVVGRLQLGNGKRSIGLRADMDALPMAELNTFEHRSTHECCMHACGHDGHTAMLLGAAEVLAERRKFDGTVIFIFQPAEEMDGGGRVMVEQGLFDRFPMEMVFGMHNWPGLPVGNMAVTEGSVMAGGDRFEIVVTGRGAHAAMPHQGIDCIVAAMALGQALQTLVSRETDPLDAAVVSITRFHAGQNNNVLPETAILGGTVRMFKPDLQQALEEGMQRICSGIADTYRVRVAMDYQRGYPPTINASEPSGICLKVASQVCGLDHAFADLKPSMGAEDFSFLSNVVPGCYAWLGNGSDEDGCALHNPHYDFNDQAIPYGVRYWVSLTEATLPCRPEVVSHLDADEPGRIAEQTKR